MDKDSSLDSQVDIPVYLSVEPKSLNSEDLVESCTLLNQSVHVWSRMKDVDKEEFLDILKGWLESVS